MIASRLTDFHDSARHSSSRAVHLMQGSVDGTVFGFLFLFPLPLIIIGVSSSASSSSLWSSPTSVLLLGDPASQGHEGVNTGLLLREERAPDDSRTGSGHLSHVGITRHFAEHVAGIHFAVLDGRPVAFGESQRTVAQCR